MSTSPPIVAVVGTTAAGKTALSLDLAARLGGEVVNTDAMALYRGMDIGTAKTSLTERRGIPHHLLDLLEVTEPASVADFQALARSTIVTLRERHATPVLVGGSALYTRAVLDEFAFPGTDPAVRARWEQRLAEVGAPALHAVLARTDPQAAAGIPPQNARRVVRALEVGELSGQSFTATLPSLTYADPRTVQVGLSIERDVLDRRIAVRVEQMYADGLLGEVERLLEVGLASGRTASRAIGYREAAAHLAGELTRAEAVEATVVATRRFARRQLAWWRKDPRIVWVAHDDPHRLGVALAAVERAAGAPDHPDQSG